MKKIHDMLSKARSCFQLALPVEKTSKPLGSPAKDYEAKVYSAYGPRVARRLVQESRKISKD